MKATTGEIGWIDLTVDDATGIRNFYKAVVGWEHEEVSMGGYADYSMTTPEGTAVSGICHARGSNADWTQASLPASQMVDRSSCRPRDLQVVGFA